MQSEISGDQPDIRRLLCDRRGSETNFRELADIEYLRPFHRLLNLGAIASRRLGIKNLDFPGINPKCDLRIIGCPDLPFDSPGRDLVVVSKTGKESGLEAPGWSSRSGRDRRRGCRAARFRAKETTIRRPTGKTGSSFGSPRVGAVLTIRRSSGGKGLKKSEWRGEGAKGRREGGKEEQSGQEWPGSHCGRALQSPATITAVTGAWYSNLFARFLARRGDCSETGRGATPGSGAHARARRPADSQQPKAGEQGGRADAPVSL